MTPGKPPVDESGIFTYVMGEDGGLKKARVVEGQLFICKGCCCGNVEGGKPAVPLTQFKHEWKARGMRNRVHLTVTACLGPCVALNVVLFVYGGQTVWFQSVNSESDVVLIYDYIETVLDRSRFDLPTGPLAEKVFRRYASDAVCSLAEDGAACAG
jgi:cobaltochelatase CobN